MDYIVKLRSKEELDFQLQLYELNRKAIIEISEIYNLGEPNLSQCKYPTAVYVVVKDEANDKVFNKNLSEFSTEELYSMLKNPRVRFESEDAKRKFITSLKTMGIDQEME